MLNYNVLW